MSREVRRQTWYRWWKRYSLWIITVDKKHDIYIEDESGLYTFLWFAKLVKSLVSLETIHPIEQRIEIRPIERKS